jgi:predicted dehydrogenase
MNTDSFAQLADLETPRPIHMPSASNKPPTIALIGCGAISEALHLPGLLRHPDVRSRLILVDPATDRTAELAARHGLGKVCADYREILDRIDGAVVAVPARLHHPVSLACLNLGVAVLCEKPLCEDAQLARELVEAAERSGATLAVNQTRRLFPANRQIRDLLAAGAIGRPLRIVYEMGEPFGWPAASDSYFGAKGSGKGVLLDTGAHIVDLVSWWLGGRPQLTRFRDDSFGGTEAVAAVELEHEGCRASIRLSWLSKLRNAYRIEGENGSIEGEVYEWASFIQRSADGKARRVRTSERPKRFEDFGHRLIDNFVDVLTNGAEPLVSGRDVLPSIEIIDECYARRERFDLPWLDTSKRIVHG